MEKYRSSVKSNLIRSERSVVGGPHSFAIVLYNDLPKPDGFTDDSRAVSSSVVTRRSVASFV